MKLSKVLLKFAVLGLAFGSVGIASRAANVNGVYGMESILNFYYSGLVKACSDNDEDGAHSNLNCFLDYGRCIRSKREYNVFLTVIDRLDRFFFEVIEGSCKDLVQQYYLENIRPVMMKQIKNAEEFIYDNCETEYGE